MGLFSSKSNKMTLHVPEMNCDHCEAKVSDALGKLGNVSEVKADSKKKRATLTLVDDQAPSQEDISQALEGSGYTATIED